MPVVTSSGPTQGDFSKRWDAKPGLARAVGTALRVGPILASVAAGMIAARSLPSPRGLTWLPWIGALVLVSQLTLLGAERLSLRVVPLSVMLRTSLVFPDQAPSRFSAALRAGNVAKMRKAHVEAVERGLPDDLNEAAATALALITTLNRHDRGTRGHSERVRAFSEMLAEELGLDDGERDRLRWGSLLHDMGKLSVPPEILNKNGRPTEEEWAILQRHPAEGARVLAPLKEWLGDAFHAADQHHERWDGKGYPLGLAAEEIALSARIVAVADAFAVMTAARAYKKPLPDAEARRELTNNAGTQFDPAVVRAMLRVSLGRTTRAAGLLAPLANVPFLGPLISSAPVVPAMVSSGAAAVAITASVVAPFSPLAFELPSAPVAAELALVADDGPSAPATSTTVVPIETVEWDAGFPAVTAGGTSSSSSTSTTRAGGDRASRGGPVVIVEPTGLVSTIAPTSGQEARAASSSDTAVSGASTVATIVTVPGTVTTRSIPNPSTPPRPTTALTTAPTTTAPTTTTTSVNPKTEKSTPVSATSTSTSTSTPTSTPTSTTDPKAEATTTTSPSAEPTPTTEPRGPKLPPLLQTTTTVVPTQATLPRSTTTTEPPSTDPKDPTTTTVVPTQGTLPRVTTVAPSTVPTASLPQVTSPKMTLSAETLTD